MAYCQHSCNLQYINFVLLCFAVLSRVQEIHTTYVYSLTCTHKGQTICIYRKAEHTRVKIPIQSISTYYLFSGTFSHWTIIKLCIHVCKVFYLFFQESLKSGFHLKVHLSHTSYHQRNVLTSIIILSQPSTSLFVWALCFAVSLKMTILPVDAQFTFNISILLLQLVSSLWNE